MSHVVDPTTPTSSPAAAPETSSQASAPAAGETSQGTLGLPQASAPAAGETSQGTLGLPQASAPAAGETSQGTLGLPQAPAPAAGETSQGTLGLPQATALVVGGVLGTGIFLLPATLAKYGTISILALGLVTIGALAIAAILGGLGARVPAAGGPYAYARAAFGEFPGFLTAWSFWITAWVGNAAIAVAWVGYVNYFLHWDSMPGKIAIALVGLWIPALINLSGVGNTGLFQVVTTVLKVVPLLFVAVVGLFFVEGGNFGEFNTSDENFLGALQVSAALVVFAYSGIEAASVAARKVENPERDIGRASIHGTLACAALYMLSTIAVMGTVPHAELVDSSAPFSDALNHMFGGGPWGGVMAAVAIVSGIGALNGWTLLCAEMPYAAAKDGVFPRRFAVVDRAGVPVFGVLVAAVLTSVVVAVNHVWSEDAFETILLLATVTTVIPYLSSASAQLLWLVTRERAVTRAALAKDLTIAVAGLLFALWMLHGAGMDAVLKSLIMLVLGIPVHLRVKAARGAYRPGDKEASRVEVEGATPAMRE